MELNWNMSIQVNHSGSTANLQWLKYEGNMRLCILQMNGSKLDLCPDVSEHFSVECQKYCGNPINDYFNSNALNVGDIYKVVLLMGLHVITCTCISFQNQEQHKKSAVYKTTPRQHKAILQKGF